MGLLTKKTGNWKKAENEVECVKASKEAYELMKKLEGETDA